MPLDRTLPELLDLHADAVKADIRKCLPAQVTAVYPSRQTVDVQIAVNDQLFDDLGSPVSMGAAALSDVPLACLRGGGFFVWLPVAVGDSVMLHFTDLAIDVWRSGDGSPADPAYKGKHTLAGAYAVPCVAPDRFALASPPGDAGAVIIGKDGADEQILITGSDIKLGAGATDFVALASKVQTAIADLATWVKTGVAPSGGGLVTYANPAPTDSVAATLVKAK